MIMYIFAVMFTKAAADVFVEPGGLQKHKVLAELYGSVGRSMYTLFLAVFGGDSWRMLAEPLFECGWAYAFIFFFHGSFMFLAVLNIVTGVFVENSTSMASQDLDLVIEDKLESNEEVVRKLRDLFGEFEEVSGEFERSGCVTEEIFEKLLEHERMRVYFQAMGIEVDEAHGLFQLLDADSKGVVNLDEFVMGCLRLRGDARTVDVVTLMYENKRVISSVAALVRDFQQSSSRLISAATQVLESNAGLELRPLQTDTDADEGSGQPNA